MPNESNAPGTEIDKILGGEGEGGTGAGTDGEEIKPVTEYEIGGEKYSREQLEGVVNLIKTNPHVLDKDYQELVPEFTKKSQLLADLEKKIAADKKLEEEANTNVDPERKKAIDEARKLLREEVGVITKEDLKPILDYIQASAARDEDKQLELISKELSAKYNGEKGEPKFDIVAIANAVKKDPSVAMYVQIGENQYAVDLEQTYRRVHREFYDKISSDLKLKPLNVERGPGERLAPIDNKKQAQSDIDRTQDAIAFFESAAKTQQ